jgi:hypothetical protein
LSAAVVCAGLTSVDRARACSIAQPPPALVGSPADGEIGVPTDVRPVFEMMNAQLYDLAGQAPVFELTSASGQTVAVSLRASFTWSFELVPETELQPLTLYTLHGRWLPQGSATEATASLSFTTGSGPLSGSVASLQASMEHYVFAIGSLSSCDPPRTGTCVSIPAGVAVKLTHIDSYGQEIGSGYSPEGEPIGLLARTPFFINLSGVEQGTNFECAKLSVRSANGSVGEPVVLCGLDAPTYQLRGSTVIGCTPEGLTHDGRLASANEQRVPTPALSRGGGCALAGEPPAGALPCLLALLLLAIRPTARWRQRKL